MSYPRTAVQGSAVQLQQALAFIRHGRLPEADALCRALLEQEPRNFNALQLLGQVALQSRDYRGAARWLASARSVNPASAAVCSNLAVAHLALGRSHEALDCCERALVLQPNYPQAHCNRGHALCALGRTVEGLAAYGQAIALAPQLYDAHTGRVQALMLLNRPEEALASCGVVMQIGSGRSDAWSLLGTVLQKLRRFAEALNALDRAIDLAPNSPDLMNNRGTLLRDLKRPAEALEMYAQALRLRPDFAEAYCNVANIGLDAGKYQEALGYCDRALRIRPDFLEALNLRGTALQALKRYEEAAASYEQILETAPDYGHARSHWLFAQAQLCSWSRRTELISAVVARLEAGESASAPHSFLWMSDSAPMQLRCASLFSSIQFPPAAPLWAGQRYRHDRLRIAYLSADFYDHPVAHLIAGVLEGHDQRRFETFGVSLYRDRAPGPMHVRMRQSFEHFHDVSELGDRQAAEWLREHEIDIAIDLTGHTRNGRLGILAFRPAPVQVSCLGFTGTSGTPYMDYLIGDATAIPGAEEPFFSERIVRMPRSFMPNDDRQSIATATPERRDLGLPEAGFVFCVFNNAYKINPPLFDLWMGLLRETPGSVLWMRGSDPIMLANLKREAKARGVDPGRLVFAARVEDRGEHLARYRQADLFLDTFPYGAHATAHDALWAGTPVLTCAGSAFASRVAASLLTAFDLPELVTATLEEYRARALTLAHSPEILAERRAKLAHQRLAGSPFDTDAYRRQLESAYLTIWERQQRGDPAQSFTVQT
ncbi:MAG TPA: tetratricopeptide repeat protein [Steroidobacteraceae bacterium]|nr:tetratricopeptide repeat protein [Steroidobacteraceae bacterium]